LGRSEEVGLHFPYQCDLLFVDGGHFNAANDIDVWIKTLVPGGILALHDFIPPPLPENNPGDVYERVLEWHAANSQYEQIAVIDRMVAFRESS
jgi:predicted O-methyltransferase YrrM